MHKTIFKSTFIHVTISPFLNTITIFLILIPITNVLCSIRPNTSALTFFLVILIPLSCINTFIFQLCRSFRLMISKLTLIDYEFATKLKINCNYSFEWGFVWILFYCWLLNGFIGLRRLFWILWLSFKLGTFLGYCFILWFCFLFVIWV